MIKHVERAGITREIIIDMEDVYFMKQIPVQTLRVVNIVITRKTENYETRIYVEDAHGS